MRQLIVAEMTMAMLPSASSEAIPPSRRALERPSSPRYWSTSLVCTFCIRAEPELRCVIPVVPVGVSSSKLKEPVLRYWQRRLENRYHLPIDGDLGSTSRTKIARQRRPFLGLIVKLHPSFSPMCIQFHSKLRIVHAP